MDLSKSHSAILRWNCRRGGREAEMLDKKPGSIAIMQWCKSEVVVAEQESGSGNAGKGLNSVHIRKAEPGGFAEEYIEDLEKKKGTLKWTIII